MADLLTATIGGGSSILVTENRKSVFDATAVDFYGNKPLTFFTVDFVAAANAEIGSNEAIQAVIEIIQKYATIVIRGALFDTNTQMCFAIETPNDTLNWDGAGAETLVEQIEDEIIALGATYGNNSFDMTAVTCTVKTGFQFA
jgi:hypothetical protein